MTLQEIKDQYAQRYIGDEHATWDQFKAICLEPLKDHMDEIAKRYAQSKVEEAKTHIEDVLLHMGLSITAKEIKNNPLPLKFD